MPTDIRFTTSGDLDISTGGLSLVTGIDAIAQHIRNAMMTLRGEIDIDITRGVPYFEEIFVKNPDLGRVEAAFGEVIAGVGGVTRVTSISASLSTSRLLTLNFRVETEGGDLAGESIADPQRAAEVSRLQGIDGLAAELRRQGADALAFMFERWGYETAPTLARHPVYGDLADLREYHEWPPLLLLLYPIGSSTR